MKRIMIFGLIFVLINMLVLSTLANPQPVRSPKAPKTVAIGHLAPMTGALAKWGNAKRIAAEIAREDVNGLNNEKGILVGGERYLIKSVFYDSAADPEKAVAALKRLASLHDVHCITGPAGTPMAMACLPLLEEYKVVMSCGVYGPVTAKGNPLILTGLEPPYAHVKALAGASWRLGLRTVCILYDKSESYLMWFKDFSKEWEALGGRVLAGEKVDTMATTDFYPVLTKLSVLNPDGIMLCTSSEPLGLLIKQAREVGYKGKFLGVSEVFPATIKIAGAQNAEGLIFSGTNQAAAGLENPPPQLQKFLTRFYEKSGGMEWAGTELVEYDTVILFAGGMEKAGTTTDPYMIRKSMMQAANQRGAQVTFMPIKGYTEGGSAYGIALNLFTVRNGKIEIMPGYTSELTAEVAKLGRGEK